MAILLTSSILFCRPALLVVDLNGTAEYFLRARSYFPRLYEVARAGLAFPEIRTGPEDPLAVCARLLRFRKAGKARWKPFLVASRLRGFEALRENFHFFDLSLAQEEWIKVWARFGFGRPPDAAEFRLLRQVRESLGEKVSAAELHLAERACLPGRAASDEEVIYWGKKLVLERKKATVIVLGEGAALTGQEELRRLCQRNDRALGEIFSGLRGLGENEAAFLYVWLPSPFRANRKACAVLWSARLKGGYVYTRRVTLKGLRELTALLLGLNRSADLGPLDQVLKK